MPYLYATAEDCSSVAAHVQLLTTAAATRPDLTDRPAVENISEVWTSFWYLGWTDVSCYVGDRVVASIHLFKAQVMKIISSAKANPSPRIMP